ncbi:MAG: hypothetical protein WA210_04545, partial [Burkholderiaceae bacterium]
ITVSYACPNRYLLNRVRPPACEFFKPHKTHRAGGALTRRFLQNIVVTFPSGWTQEEIDAYEQAWVYARNIFYWTRYPERLVPRVLEFEADL